jgi:hypothetical protein
VVWCTYIGNTLFHLLDEWLTCVCV